MDRRHPTCIVGAVIGGITGALIGWRINSTVDDGQYYAVVLAIAGFVLGCIFCEVWDRRR